MKRRHRPAASLVAGIVAAAVVAGCDVGSRADTTTSTVAPSTATPTATTTVSVTPVTPDGLLTGPGVDAGSITLGVLVDPEVDRGFISGVKLWQEAVNTSGGLCGRVVQLSISGDAGVPADLLRAYDALGRSSLGLITLESDTGSADLEARIQADQIPTLTPAGSSAALGSNRPVVIGPTADVLAINGLEYLAQLDRVSQGGSVGVLTDGSAMATDALNGARWWADDRGVTLDVRTTGEDTDLANWGSATSVLSLADPATTSLLAAATPADTTILTTLDGYDPAAWSKAGIAAAAAGRVLLSTAAPAYGSDYPAAVSVAARAASTGVPPATRLFDGYATGVNWDRLLTDACAERNLTRPGVTTAMGTVGPASVDSLFGPTDPALPAQNGRPATLVSAMSVATPSAQTGLGPLTWPEAASGIEDYLP